MNAPRTALDGALDRQRFAWALAALLAMSLPHVLHLAAWVTAAAGLIILWRLALGALHRPLPRRYLPVALGAAAFLGVYATYRTLNGVEAGTALLVLLAALKLMEARGPRDYFLLLLIALFLGIANFLYEQTIALALYMAPALWLAVSALLAIAHPDPARAPLAAARAGGRLLLPALPLAAVLFLLFPRVPGPLWGIGLQQRTGVTGLGTRMSPGSLSALARSDAVAFRVRFLGAVPPRAELYWRALVLHDYDGQSWTVGEAPSVTAGPAPPGGNRVRYSLTLEPNDLRVLYTLDLPVEAPPDTRLTRDYEVLTRRPITERYRYEAVSEIGARYGAGARGLRLQRDLYLPRGIDPRARELAQRWRAAAASPAQIVAQALRYFHDRPFHYTLEPGVLTGRNGIDRFLFDLRRGFCEHYASAFVFLMRAAGVPAHVVIGYQGGRLNPLDGYYVVRQEDAHAWAEVWLTGRGWVRVDPTAAVDPARVDEGLAAALPAAEVPGYLFDRHPWLGRLRDGWDAVNNGWNQWVLAYGPELQRRFFRSVGLDYGNWLELAVTLAALIGGLLLLVWLAFWWRNRPPPPDPLLRDYRRWCKKLARIGLSRKPHEGPLDYARRVAAARPDLAATVQAIAARYAELRYAGRGERRELRRLIGAFRPR